ncbi:hypothetical protein [Clostridium perfringens]|uniref:hypothetical protein n=1 Tax=Clostridium perfringens TaxID=1502 RepID=UPI00156DA6EA|nr:hypothetical protein [Clostridium perfringens]MDU7977729.1 hypothetical protein [Clostridioides difficile]EGT0690950.1 hypothetical protein [Clostridium perfringens]EGT0694102.1 hypothetical protein [Clostridium perfringens]MBI6024426.1 hypothetical protein [Clostridium perfringens]MBI6048791.1 hypothetical protein [Clostridium perfringens]
MTPRWTEDDSKIHIINPRGERKVLTMPKYKCLNRNGYCQLIQISSFIFRCKKCGRTVIVKYSEQ